MKSKNEEIERRFLVNSKEFLRQWSALESEIHPSYHIKQGYLSSIPATRIRIYSDMAEVPQRAEVTVKGKGSVRKAEYNLPVAPEGLTTAITCLSAMCPAWLRKLRRHSLVGATEWHVDQFLGRHEGLWTAEVELGSEDEAFEMPIWLGREVTGDKRYSNLSLAMAERPPVG